jgi:RecA-family ATPase
LKVSLSDIPPHRQWLYGVDLLRGDLSLLVSPGAVGKTSLALGMAASVAIGKPLLGEKIWGSGPLKSLYINAEDSGIEMRRRALAFCQQHTITQQELDRLYIAGTDDLRVRGLSFLSPAGQNSSVLDQAGLAHLDSLLASLLPDLVVIDPLIALCGGGNVNDNAAMALVMREIKRLAIKYNCSILIVHHTRKGGDPGSAEAISGASAIKDLARCARMPVTMTTAEQTTFGVLPSERPQHFKLVDAKSNLSLHSDEAWYKLQSQELPNAEPPTYPHGDRVQAVVRAQLRHRDSASVTADDQKIEAAILELVDRGKEIDGQFYPYSPSPAGANNERALMPDATAAVANATAPRHWAPGDLEAVIKTAISKMQADGRLVVEDMGDLMPKPGRFRRARGLKAVPI